MGSFTTVQLFTLLVSSSVLAALISFAGNHILAQLQFRRDYFKEIIHKRLNAYEQVDELIGILRLTTYDESGRIAHVLFLNKAIYDRATFVAATAIGLSLYVSVSIRDMLSEISVILTKRPDNASDRDLFELGVLHREELANLRQKLEHLVASDLLKLDKVHRFLKAKEKLASKPSRWFVAWLPRHGGFSFPERRD
jgi:hypothetical protein